ncbi:hypothetical protein RclHR1_08540013 [Rhizophagus clarus]|uniref:Uncharacterized protein n=1 Tax=Rhizophagus clarus TaxID=94130 RepID=A0A2Z6S1F4_9GLOM|nr:hypothetical protein RclHR1_08540013 [Rhizophagus clarus]
MKSHLSALIISIIFSLLIAFTSFTGGKTVWVHNKLTVGTWAAVTATNDSDGIYNIAQDWSVSHNGFHVDVPDNYPTFYLFFDVIVSTQDTKERGPFDNNQDSCWHFHGHLDSWDIYSC